MKKHLVKAVQVAGAIGWLLSVVGMIFMIGGVSQSDFEVEFHIKEKLTDFLLINGPILFGSGLLLFFGARYIMSYIRFMNNKAD